MTIEEQTYHKVAESIEGAVKSQMFGKPCYKMGKKAFCCFFQQSMVFKLNKEMHDEAMSLDGTFLFDPSGKNRPMKEWVQVPFDYKEDWEKFAHAAAEYVS